jgi:hypothetical protein
MDYGKSYSVKGKKTKPVEGTVCIQCLQPITEEQKPHFIQTKRGTTHFIHKECVKAARDGVI